MTITPTCSDSTRNGNETGIDCGGTCGATCAIGVGCDDNSDCISGLCGPSTDLCENPPEYVDVNFTVVDGVVASEWSGWEDARFVLRSAVEFEMALGVAPPIEIDFDTEWALFHSVGKRPIPGFRTTIDAIEVETTGSELRVSTTLHSPADDCETFHYAIPTWALVRFDQIPGLVEVITEDRTPQEVACLGGVTENNTCTSTALCEPGLLCAGIARTDTGTCMPVSQWGVFAETHPVAIPDDGSTALTRSLTASGLTTVDMDVVVTVELTHPDASELVITLTNPSGNEVGVWNHEVGPHESMRIERVPVGFSGDESVNGTWTLEILDDEIGNEGSLDSWSVEIMSRWD